MTAITVLPEHILKLMSAKDRAALGRGALTAEEAMDKCATREESKMHDLIIADLKRRKIPFIHASMKRRVRDLPVGWPDFTVFAHGETALVELKALGGKLSDDQKRVIAELEHSGSKVLVTCNTAAAINYIKTELDL